MRSAQSISGTGPRHGMKGWFGSPAMPSVVATAASFISKNAIASSRCTSIGCGDDAGMGRLQHGQSASSSGISAGGVCSCASQHSESTSDDAAAAWWQKQMPCGKAISAISTALSRTCGMKLARLCRGEYQLQTSVGSRTCQHILSSFCVRAAAPGAMSSAAGAVSRALNEVRFHATRNGPSCGSFAASALSSSMMSVFKNCSISLSAFDGPDPSSTR